MLYRIAFETLKQYILGLGLSGIKGWREKIMQKKLWIPLFALFAVGFQGGACAPQSRAVVQETRETITTYAFAEPDPVPILTRSGLWGRGARLYPYTFIDQFSREGKPQEWKVVRLDNPYISVAVLPEVGGKVWGALEKSTGREFIYTNKALKFREIALRGPWTSGGLEFNFGIVGHTPSGAHPVDYVMLENPDGSVSCVVGNLDLPSRTRWSVSITLPPDKAFFETRAFWYNPTSLNQSYYVWMNGAVRTSDDLQYTFPGTSRIGHDYSVSLKNWPVDSSGRDLSWYRNNNFGSYKSYFTVGEYEDWFGGYWHDSEFGFGHWARYDDVPGHKLWIWGLSRQGMIWEDLLTDQDGQYSEPQSGRLLNQSDHSVFPPYSGDRWKELWFPFKKIGPMVKASPYAALSLLSGSDTLKIGICALQSLDEDLIIEIKNQEAFRERIRLNPMQTWVKELDLPHRDEFIHLRIGDKLQYSNNPLDRKVQKPIHFQNYSGDTFQKAFLAAERLFQERNYLQALPAYRELLNKQPDHLQALCRTAELLGRRGELSQALEIVEKALDVSMYDPDANQVYAQLARRSGRLLDAKEALGWAARSYKYRSAAYTQMAEIFLIEKNLVSAQEYCGRALEYDVHNLNSLQCLAIALRLYGDSQAAAEILERILQVDPLNHIARFEKSRLDSYAGSQKKFQDGISNEYAGETCMEMALYYLSLGLADESAVLFESGKPSPMANLWLAFLFSANGQDRSQNELDKAVEASPDWVFPFREESIPVLKWATGQRPKSWKLKYYLGLLLWSKGRVEEAEGLFEACGQPEYAPFYHARAYFRIQNTPMKAQADYEKAWQLDPEGWRNVFRLMEFYTAQGLKELALSTAQIAAEKFPESGPIQVGLCKALMAMQMYGQAAEILDGLEVLPSEGATGVHDLYVETNIRLALENIREGELESAVERLNKAKQFPENLGSGRPYFPDLRKQEYLEALCMQKLGERDAARTLFQSIHTFTLEQPLGKTGPYTYYGALVLANSPEKELARNLLETAERPGAEVWEAIRILEK